MTSNTRRVVPKAQGHEEKSPASLLPLLAENFEKGCYHRVSHYSICYQSNMTFGIFIPSSYANDPNESNPVLLFLGGLLTCDDTNFLESESGQCAFEAAERQGIAIVIPADTSPRGPDVLPRFIDEVSDLALIGAGASFDTNATTAHQYSAGYHMYEYVAKELQFILENNFNMGKKGLKSICVQNMGGEALTIALCEGSRSWRSVSALTPICNPRKRCLTRRREMIFDKYFVYPPDEGWGKIDDAAYVLASLDCSSYDNILIDLGSADILMEDQCKPYATITAAEECIQNKDSYFFVAKFVKDHVDFHAKRLLLKE